MENSDTARQAWTVILRRLGNLPAAKLFNSKLDLAILTPRYLGCIAPSSPTSLSEAELWLNLTTSDKLAALPELRRPMLNALRFNIGPLGEPLRISAIKLLHRLDDEVEKNGPLCAALQGAGRPFTAVHRAFPEAAACESALELFAKEPGVAPGVAACNEFWYPFDSYFLPGDPKVAEYKAKISAPTCLADVCARFYNAEFPSLDALRAAVSQVFDNAREFWGPSSDISKNADALCARFDALLEAALVAPVRAPGGGGSRDRSRAALPSARPPPDVHAKAAPTVLAVAAAPSPPVAAPAPPPFSVDVAAAYAPGSALSASAAPPPPVRRGYGGAAVAAVHRASGRLSRDEARRCLGVLTKLEAISTTSNITGQTVHIASPFLNPVSRVLVEYPEYGRLIANPIDLHIIRAKLEQEPPDYASVVEFSADVLLMVANCRAFNTDPDSRDVVVLADKLWERFRALFNDAFVGIATVAHQPSHYPPGTTSHGMGSVRDRDGTKDGSSASAPAPRPYGASSSQPATKLVIKVPSVLPPAVPPSVDSGAAVPPSTAQPPPAIVFAPTAGESFPSLFAPEDSAAGGGLSVDHRRKITLRVGPVETEEEWVGPRTLYDIPLATDKKMQEDYLDRLLFRLCKIHPYAQYFQEPYRSLNPEVYDEMARRGITQIKDVAYGLRTIHRSKFKDDVYPSVGHLNEDVVNFFAQGISIHSHAAWGQTSDEWQLLASEMARRSRRMQEYWHALIVEYFHNVKGLVDKVDALREEREKYINDRPVLQSTHADLARVVTHMTKFDQKKFFSKPAIEIWPDLPRYWVAKPIDLSTVKTRIFENYYKCYKDFLAELYLVYDNAIEYNNNAPPGSVGAAVREAAEASIWEVLQPWADRTIEIYAKVEADGLAKTIEARTARLNQAHEAEAERTALAQWEAEEARRRLATVGSLLSELDDMWLAPSQTRGVEEGHAGAPPTVVSVDALLLSAQGCPANPPRSIDAGLLPRLRITLIKEQLRDAERVEREALAQDSSDSPLRVQLLRQAALAAGRALVSHAVRARPDPQSSVVASDANSALAGSKRSFSELHQG